MLWLNHPESHQPPGPHPDKENDWNTKSWIWFEDDDDNKPNWWTAEPKDDKE